MLIKNQKDFVAGLLFVITGLAFAIAARDYSIGQAARMGPGYFPFLLGILLAILGLVMTVKSFTDQAGGDHSIGKLAFKPLFFVLGANLLFGALLVGVPALGIPQFGLIVGIFGLVIVASLAGEEFRLRDVLILSVVLAIISYVAFVKLLNLQFPVWPAFLSN